MYSGLYENFAFSGGGVLGIAYIGMLDYLYEIGMMPYIQRVVGTSAGAITACITAFNLDFAETKVMADSLDYSRVPSKTNPDAEAEEQTSAKEKKELGKLFDNADCVYRLITQYGWYSSSYFYEWMRRQIAEQFDEKKKKPPYTFADFAAPVLHKGQRAFKELYIIGTDVSTKTSSVFCLDTTPEMEVAEAVRISMSVPLFFEAVKSGDETRKQPKVYADGGLLYNYPLTFFDQSMSPSRTLGAVFLEKSHPAKIDNIIDFIVNLLSCTTAIQSQLYSSSPQNVERSIQIETGSISSLDFNIKTGDKTYKYLYQQGYQAARTYFQRAQGPLIVWR